MSSGSKRTHFLPEAPANRILRLFKIVAGLEIQPELRRHAEIASETQGNLCRDGTLPVNDLVDRHGGYAKRLRQSVLAQTVRFNELLKQDFPGVMSLRWLACFMAVQW